ncbi:hypothetical protein [Rhodococcus opacus]|uniref:hypothetical protein n=1 Tax=Rhodococcus opacus TaxID=37919 RepID=UPI001F5AB59A|nr:hypothetical protein [Rhodococcus opacus]UNN05253.1 hypothetical protein MOO23_40255 [Rhodococcus opacus]
MNDLAGEDEDREIAERAVARMPMQRPWSLDRLIAELSLQRGRPIVTAPLQRKSKLSGEVSGLWVPREDRDLVFYRDGATGMQRDAIICHELGHIVLSHGRLSREAVARYNSRLNSRLPREMITRFSTPLCLMRSQYEEPVERQAEWFSRILLGKGSELTAPLVPEDASPRHRRMLERAARAFGWDQ